MNLLSEVRSLDELKKNYKKLALVYHPDAGGTTELMQQLNEEYQQRKTRLFGDACLLSELKEKSIVFVNGTECIVTHVSEHAFIAKAKRNGRTAVFDKKTGFAIGNKKFKAIVH